jgi:hypothetical protein
VLGIPSIKDPKPGVKAGYIKLNSLVYIGAYTKLNTLCISVDISLFVPYMTADGRPSRMIAV